MSIESVMPSNHLILCHPLLFLLSSIFPSIRVFSNESALHMNDIFHKEALKNVSFCILYLLGKSTLNIYWKDWCWRWSSNTWATRSEELTPFGKDLKAGKDWGQKEKGMAEDEMVGWHHWLNGHKFWVNFGSWRWIGRPGMLQSMALQRVKHDWTTELN